MLVAIYKAHGIDRLVKWVDDFFAIHLPGDRWSEKDFMDLTSALGVPWSIEKMRPFAVIQRYIGFDWDLEKKRVSLPQEKLVNILNLISTWLLAGHKASMHNAASLHGKLIHVSSIFLLIRPFLRALAHFPSSFTSPRAVLHPPPAVLADLDWVRFIISSPPNSLPLRSPAPLDIGWWGDASSSFGIGVVVQGLWAVWQWQPGFKVGPNQEFDIGWAEAVAVELGLRLALSFKVITQREHSGSSFLVRSDNSGVVAVTNKGRSRSRNTNKVLKEVICSVMLDGRTFTLYMYPLGLQDPLHVTGNTLSYSRGISRQYIGCPILGGHPGIPGWFPSSSSESILTATTPFGRQVAFVVAPASAVRILPSLSAVPSIETTRSLQLSPSPLRPEGRSRDRIFTWKGVNTPPPAVLDFPILHHISRLASRSLLRDSESYGAGLRKFHLFCDIFSVAETDRLPASFALLHSFVLWAATDPDPMDLGFADGTPFETVSVSTARKYLSAVRAWHIAQGWPSPLSDGDHERIDWALRGLNNIQASRRTRPPRPPITLPMMRALRLHLDHANPFDACVWAMCACAFFGLMRFGEVSVKSRSDFSSARNLTRADGHFIADADGRPYLKLSLPMAKTAAAGEIQDILLVEQKDVDGSADLCPIAALHNLARVVPAAPQDPLFSWRDRMGHIRPMVKTRALERINSILSAWGWGTAFGHSFRIGGASWFLSKGASPEVVRIQGRWKSLAYEAYIRAFELIASRHLANLITSV